MRAPITQEEVDFRTHFADRVTAISNVNSLFSDVEDKARRLTILKALVTGLHLGDEVNAEIDKEIMAAKEAAKKAAEQEEAEAAAANGEGEDLDLNVSEEPAEEGGSELDLTPMPDEEIKEENFKPEPGTIPLTEDQSLSEDDDLPPPEEADADRDFTENK